MKTIYLIGALVLMYSCKSSKNQEKQIKKDTIGYVAPAPVITPAEKEQYGAIAKKYLDSTFRSTKFNGSIIIAKNGVPVYESYTGYRNLRLKDSITSHTALQIASTSKTLTSAAILQLVQLGKLNLNTPVAQFFPGFPFPDITVKMLLSHRSGLPEYLYFFEKNGWDRKKFATNNDVINFFTSGQVQRAYRANTHFDYCNTNFVLLASIVEKVSGMPFPQYMKQNIFTPLHMDDTYINTISDTARSTHSFNWDGSMWALDFSDGTYGDKNVFSTPRDLLKWDQALYTGQFIAKPLLDSAFTPYSNEKKSMHNYGLGWRMMMYPNGKKVIYHNGRWHGFNSAFARLTDEKVTIIMLSNRFNKYIYTIARKMYNSFGPYDLRHGTDLE